MQTTLLGFGIAIILALVTALVGPIFVDWGRYRSEFEARASRLTGLQVRVAGPIEARLLPTPTLTLQQIEVRRSGQAGTVRARKLDIEFALGALIRGEWSASDVHLEGAEFALGLDSSGRIDWPAPSVGFDPDSISIQRLDIADSRAVLADAVSGARLVLDKLEFSGELRSLAGPVKGEGSFLIAGQHYPYRIAANRADDNGAVKIRLNIDPIDRPLTADAEGLVWIERGAPRFEGALQLARPVGRAAEGSQALIVEPWRITSRVKGDSTAAVVEQIEFQYGPDDRAIKLRGDAKLTFGRAPHLNGVLSAAQIDLDRILALPEATRRRPFVAIKSFAEYFIGAQRLPIPVKLGISAETVTLAGATLQRLSGDVKIDGQSWDIETLDFRAPGFSQVRLSGRFGVAPGGVNFAGPAKIEAGDLRTLVAWLTDRADTPAVAAGALRAEGEVKLSSETIAIDRLKAELDRMNLQGRLAYFWASGDRPPRIEAALSAPEIDLDRTYSIARGMFGDTAFEWPREGKLSVKVDRALIAGINANRTDVSMQFDRRGIEIEQLSIGDFGGAVLSVNGRIDTRAHSPRGNLTLDLSAHGFDGVAALIEKVAPQAADQLRHTAGRFVPAQLHASLSVGSEAVAASAPAASKFRIEGRAGTFRINFEGGAAAASDDAAGDASLADKLSQLAATRLNLTGRIEAGDGTALVELLGLDRLVAVDKRPSWIDLTAGGPFNGDIAIGAQLIAGGLDVAVKGTMRLLGHQGPTAGLALKVANANLRTARPVPAGRPADTLPTTLAAKLAVADGVLGLTDLSGKIAGTEVGGRLNIGFSHPLTVTGEVEFGTVNVPAAIAAAIGMPPQGASGALAWPAEPFKPGLLGTISGQIVVKSELAALTPKLSARAVRGVLHFDQFELAIEEIDGSIAGGRVAGGLMFERGADGLTARSRIRFASADAAELLPGDGQPLSGRLTFDVNVEGTGRSPVALIGALTGSGTFTLQDGQIAHLNPAAFETMIRAVDQGLPIDVARVRDRMDSALAVGNLPVPLAEGTITITGGQARLGGTMVHATGADLALSATADLTKSVIDARLTLSRSVAAGAAAKDRPEIVIGLKGSIDAPKRTLEVDALASWLAMHAVEQQAKRLNVLEADRELPAQQSRPGPPAASAPEAGLAIPTLPRTTSGVPTIGTKEPPRASQAVPSAEQLPPLPPPITIRPAPVPRAPRTPRTEKGAARVEGASHPPAKPMAAHPPISAGRSTSETSEASVDP